MRRLPNIVALTLAGAGAALLVLAVLALAGVFGDDDSPPVGALAQGGKRSESIVERAREGIVSVVARRGRRVSATSGFLLDRNGMIVTVAGAVPRGAELSIQAEGTTGLVPAELRGRDSGAGIALLKIARDDARDIRPLDRADPSSLQLGEAVMAVGAPFSLEGTVTAGVTSAFNRQAPGGVQGALAVDAAIGRGNAGGPLIDGNGRVIGVALGGRGRVGYALPVDALTAAIQAIEERGSLHPPDLGMSTTPVDPGLARTLDIPVEHGLLVTSVASGGPAARAGLRPARADGSHADVVTQVAGLPVRRPEDVGLALAGRRRQTVRLGVSRGNRQLTLVLRLRR